MTNKIMFSAPDMESHPFEDQIDFDSDGPACSTARRGLGGKSDSSWKLVHQFHSRNEDKIISEVANDCGLSTCAIHLRPIGAHRK